MSKNMLESSEVFQAYAILDFLHYQLEEIIKENARPLRTPIECAIDEASGYDAEPMLEKRMKKRIQSAIEIVEQIIHYKGIAGIEADGSVRLLKKLKELIQMNHE